MRNHLSMRSANPALSANAFTFQTAVSNHSMTIQGTVNKTALCLGILGLCASVSWQNPNSLYAILGAIGGLILAIATIYKKTWAPYTTPMYSACEGLLLGVISYNFESRFPGIASQAIFLTFGVLAALLLIYRSGLIKVTNNFRLGLFAATGGIAMIYFVGFILSFFGISIPLIHGSSFVGILFSLGVCVVAALNLVLDFDFIEQGAERGAPKYMEWYGAFGLMVTLVWLYIEILRLLSKLQSRK
jgi:uncharacterized YccA/Bax inhibitor family protein